jgi:hypothetical protein
MDTIQNLKKVETEDLEIIGERMEPLDEVVFSKYLKLEIVVPLKFKNQMVKNQTPQWYKNDPNKGLIQISPDVEKIMEVDGNKHFIYFVNFTNELTFSCTRIQTNKLVFHK